MTEDRPQHPLDPLTADEVARAWSLVRARDGLGPRVRVVSIALAEPLRAALRGPGADHPVERVAFVVLMDSDAHKTYEAVVSLTRGRVVSLDACARGPAGDHARRVRRVRGGGAQPSPGLQAALRKRGVKDVSL